MIGLYIVLLVFIIILVMPLKVRAIRSKVTKNKKTKKPEKQNNIDVYLVKIFNIRLDVDEIIDYFMKDEENKITFETITSTGTKIKMRKNIFRTLFSFIPIRKLTITYNCNNILMGILAWNSIYYLRNKLIALFFDVDNEYYNVKYIIDEKNNENNLEFELVFYFRLYHLLYAYLINVKDLIKIVKTKKGSVRNV